MGYQADLGLRIFMRNRAILLLLVWQLLFFPVAGWSQGMVEAGGGLGIAGGLGAGLAASASHGRAVARSYEAMAKSQQALLAQTQAIEHYMKAGCQFEAAKQWGNAEKSFKYVLQVVAARDGPGSNKGVPALKHLVAVSQAQNKLDEAIGFQKTVVSFTKRASIINPAAVINEQCNLSNLYVQYGDYGAAEPVLKEAVTFCDAHPSLSVQQQRATRLSYAQVLRQMHRDSEAEAIESPLAYEKKTNAEQAILSIETQGLKASKASSVKADGQKEEMTDAEQRINQLAFPPNMLSPDPSASKPMSKEAL
jgi:hypothetical protein